MEVRELSIARTLLGAGASEDVAVVEGDRTVTYAGLRSLVVERVGELALPERGVVVLGATNTLEFVVTYLALLEDGHVPLLAGAHLDRLASLWRPGAVVTTSAHGMEIERHAPDRRPLHPDLRLLLSTSGSTGAPKLVRLSDRNLVTNAGAIAEFLGLGRDDRAITSLPLHYCYGLSVLHSHLAAGAAVVLTEASVVDPCFGAAMADHGVTNLAGVPHTFELLERAGPERIRVPSLRFVTVAGGRMAPEAVARWAERGTAWGGVDLYVMYGQTEATARMAYLPPGLARDHPAAIGVPIPGGSLTLRPVDGQPDGVGELVYRGDNVMLGYAVEDADLAAGATLDELATGDLGRFDPAAGLFEIVGRRSRFVKPFGLRIDLDVVEDGLAAAFGEVAVAGDDELVAVVAPGADTAAVAAAVGALTGLPAGCVAVVEGPIPRTERGKVDGAAVLAAARCPSPPAPAVDASVAATVATVLGRRHVRPTDTFVSLGGDSLNYVECSLRLERLLGPLPPDWHLRPIGALEPPADAIRRSRPRLDATVVLRAAGICTIVATHMRLHYFPGGAHILLAVVGYNVARFLLPIESGAGRVRAGLRTAARAAVPTVVWVALGMALFGAYSAGTLLLVNNYVGPPGHRDDHWHFWFIEVFVHLVVLTSVVLAVPAVARLDRAHPYAFPLVLLGVSLLLRLEWAQMGDWYNLRFRTHGIAWFFLLGWLIQRSTTTRARLLTTAAVLATVPGFFDRPQREWFVVAALVLLLWVPVVAVPRAAIRPVTAVAATSMWILLTHFTTWPLLVEHLPLPVAYASTIATGVVAGLAFERASQLGRRVWSLRPSFPARSGPVFAPLAACIACCAGDEEAP